MPCLVQIVLAHGLLAIAWPHSEVNVRYEFDEFCIGNGALDGPECGEDRFSFGLRFPHEVQSDIARPSHTNDGVIATGSGEPLSQFLSMSGLGPELEPHSELELQLPLRD